MRSLSRLRPPARASLPVRASLPSRASVPARCLALAACLTLGACAGQPTRPVALSTPDSPPTGSPSAGPTPSTVDTRSASPAARPSAAATGTSAPRPAPVASPPPGTGRDESTANGPRLGSYQVRISGATAGREFQRTGTVTVLSTMAVAGTGSGVNPVEVCLVSGAPGERPEVGAIWFGTNSGCLPGTGAATVDLAYVSTSGTTVTAQPDERIAATLANTFTATTATTACPYLPVAGSLRLNVGPDGNLTGTIELTGRGAGPCDPVSYEARITSH